MVKKILSFLPYLLAFSVLFGGITAAVFVLVDSFNLDDVQFLAKSSYVYNNTYPYKYKLRALENRSDLSQITETNNAGWGVYIGIGLAQWGGTAENNKILTYTFFRETDEGGIVLEKIPACYGEIYEDVENQEDAYVEQIYRSVLEEERASGGLYCENVTLPWKFHIPKGAIKSDFNLDVNN